MQPSPSESASVDRASVLRGGALGLGIGVLLLALSSFFLVRGYDEPEEILGVFVPLGVALIALATGVMALVPLRYGDTADHSPGIIATLLRLLGLLGLVITALGVLRGQLPWVAGAALPLLVVAALLISAGRFAVPTTERTGESDGRR